MGHSRWEELVEVTLLRLLGHGSEEEGLDETMTFFWKHL